MIEVSFSVPCIIITTILCFAWETLNVYINYLKGKSSAEEIAIRQEITDTKAKISKMSTVSDFVAKSRAERSLVKMEKALEVATKQRETTPPLFDLTLPNKYGVPIVGLLLVMFYWGTVIATVPATALGPAARILTLPGKQKGEVGIISWLILVRTVSKTVVQALAVQFNFIPENNTQKGMLGSIMDLVGKLSGK